VLKVAGLCKSFGGLQAVDGLSFRVEPGQFFGVIGANGAGKTTLLNLITGYLPPTAGTIEFEGRRIDGLPPYRVARLGIGRTFQIAQPFAEMSVLENVMTGALFARTDAKLSIGEARDACRECLDLVGLAPLAERPAGSLTLGAKKKLELARALASRPRLLLLDEVMGGLTRPEVDDLMVSLGRVRAAGTTILMIEHLVHVIVALSDHVLVLDFGRELLQGGPQEVVRHPDVVQAYLGRPLETDSA